MKQGVDLLGEASDVSENLERGDLVGPAVVHGAGASRRKLVFSHAVAVVEIAVRPFAQARRHLLPRFLRVGGKRAGLVAADEDLVLLAFELAARHVEVGALLVVFLAEVVRGVRHEVELLVRQGFPVLAFEAVLVQPHEARVLGHPRVLAPVSFFASISLSTATETRRSAGLPVWSDMWIWVWASIRKTAIEESAIVRVESAAHLVGESLQVPQHPSSSFFWPFCDEGWMV